MRLKKTAPRLLWLGLTLAIAGYLGYPLLVKDQDRRVFVPGDTSHGHYQIEMACDSCHARSFGGAEVLQDACINCHGAELKQAKDSHPKSKFTDPRNADRVSQLDARYCATCHVEHKTEITGPMGVTVPDDYCFKCHQDIAEERSSHRDLDFKSCATGGCHNFHDNRALYEDFLTKHLHEPELLPQASVAQRNLGEFVRLISRHPIRALTSEDKNLPTGLKQHPKISDDWLNTGHAAAGVNCNDCHAPKNAQGLRADWQDKVGHDICMNCHKDEGEGFLRGRHGMRLAEGLTPMTPGMARQPMHGDAFDKELSCVSCHGAHRFDTRQAAVESCLTCHADEHSLAYKDSPHFGLWHREAQGLATKGSGVSCATCHLPREVHQEDDFALTKVQHNQNANLRPNEKMIRGVCMNCHGLSFSIDALADGELVKRNFKGRPGAHVESLDWAERRLQEAKSK